MIIYIASQNHLDSCPAKVYTLYQLLLSKTSMTTSYWLVTIISKGSSLRPLLGTFHCQIEAFLSLTGQRNHYHNRMAFNFARKEASASKCYVSCGFLLQYIAPNQLPSKSETLCDCSKTTLHSHGACTSQDAAVVKARLSG